MALAMEQARLAGEIDEVPVGAVVVLDGEVVGTGYNKNRSLNDPSAHAEIIAIRAAAQTLNNYRLTGAQLYVTLEPCVMCAGAILHARIKTLIYATQDERWGAAGSVANILESPLMSHHCAIVAGVRKAESSELLKSFFKVQRNPNKC